MLIEEEPKDEPKIGDINPDALEAVFADEGDILEEVDVMIFEEGGEEPDEIDIAFQANDEGYW
jgi:hypothetical protein